MAQLGQPGTQGERAPAVTVMAVSAATAPLQSGEVLHEPKDNVLKDPVTDYKSRRSFSPDSLSDPLSCQGLGTRPPRGQEGTQGPALMRVSMRSWSSREPCVQWQERPWVGAGWGASLPRSRARPGGLSGTHRIPVPAPKSLGTTWASD